MTPFLLGLVTGSALTLLLLVAAVALRRDSSTALHRSFERNRGDA